MKSAIAVFLLAASTACAQSVNRFPPRCIQQCSHLVENIQTCSTKPTTITETSLTIATCLCAEFVSTAGTDCIQCIQTEYPETESTLLFTSIANACEIDETAVEPASIIAPVIKDAVVKNSNSLGTQIQTTVGIITVEAPGLIKPSLLPSPKGLSGGIAGVSAAPKTTSSSFGITPFASLWLVPLIASCL